MNACTSTRSTPCCFAIFNSAYKCACCECTPPSETSPNKCNRRPPVRACFMAATSVGSEKKSPFWQTDERPAGMDEGIGIVPQKTIVNRLAGKGDRIGVDFGAVSPAIEDDENERFRTGHKSAFSS